MANFLYNGQPIAKMIAISDPEATPLTTITTNQYRVAGVAANDDFVNKYKSFHSKAAPGTRVSFSAANAYQTSSVGVYGNDTCPAVYWQLGPSWQQVDPYAEGSSVPPQYNSWKQDSSPVYNAT